jgi:hypothetical protein
MAIHEIPYMMEVTYPFYLGGQIMDGYQCDDQIMAQSSIDGACASATYIERQRIIAILEAHVKIMESEHQDPSEIWGLEQAIALIKGEN